MLRVCIGGKRGRRVRLTGRDTLDASTTRETTDGGLGYALDVVTEDLAVTLRAAFAEAFATFSACGVDVSMSASWKAMSRVVGVIGTGARGTMCSGATVGSWRSGEKCKV